MAQPQPVDPFNVDFSAVAAENRPIYRRLGLLNGLLIGLGLGLGAWGLEAWRVAQLPMTSHLPLLLLGLGLIVSLCGLVGWLTSRVAQPAVTTLLWGAMAVISMLVMGYLHFYGYTLAVWLTDPRFRGRDVSPYTMEGRPSGLILGGLLIILILMVLGLLQNYRLENITSEVSHGGRINGRAWLALLLPLPLVFTASLITQSVMVNPAPAALDVANRAISVAQDYEGDLRLLDRGDGISYGALRPVHDLIGGPYTLSIVDVNPLTSTVVVGADFEAGGWVYCRIINEQLTFCYDASPLYTDGLRALITGNPPPETCLGCLSQATEEANAWLVEQRSRFGDDPAVERVAQRGGHVLMRVSGDDITTECWIEGLTPIRLTECREVNSIQ